jgi:hypothetical protein
MNGYNRCDSESEPQSQLQPLLNEREYVAITGEILATAHRNRLLKKGCPYVKLGAFVKYRPEDVRAYIERNLRPNSLEVQ